MPARVVELAQAVADYISGQTYSKSFTAQRKMLVRSDLKDTRLTQIFIYPQYDQGKQLPVDTRDAFGRTYTIIVHIVNFVDNPNEQDEIDISLLLAEEVEGSLENIEQAGFAMLGFGAEQSASFLEEGQLQERMTYNVVIPVVYVTVD